MAEAGSLKGLSVQQYKAMRDRGEAHHLFDVRTEGEREQASIAGSTLLDEEGQRVLAALPRDTPLVFQCHHGIRSMAAAGRALRLGFTHVYNLTGGIDAWSVYVDPSVPRY